MSFDAFTFSSTVLFDFIDIGFKLMKIIICIAPLLNAERERERESNGCRIFFDTVNNFLTYITLWLFFNFNDAFVE